MSNIFVMKERLLQIAAYLGLSVRSFEAECGLQRGNISNMSESGAIGSDKLSKIYVKYPELNLEWLLTGIGSMLKGKLGQVKAKEYIQQEEVNNIASEPNMQTYNFKSDYFNLNNQLIPLYEIEAAAGLNTLFSNQTDQSPIDYISVPNAPKCDGALFVRGDSMYPIMKSGDIVCYKQIKDTQNNIRFGEIYLLYIDDGDDEYLTIKYVQTSERGKRFVKLVSHNQYHAPKDEAISNIKALAIIKLSIRYNTIS